MVSLLSKGAPLCLHSGLLKLCDCDWNLAIDREIATFCFCPTSNALKKNKPENCTTKIVQLNKSLQSKQQCNLTQVKKKNTAASRFTLHAFA